MEAIRGVRLSKFKLRKIILGVRMHFRHIFPGQDKAVPSIGEVAEEWKPPDKIYTIDNTINTILHYMLGFFFFLFLFPPSTSLSLLFILFSFNPSSFLIILFSSSFLFFLNFSFHIFSHIFFSHKTQKHSLTSSYN